MYVPVLNWAVANRKIVMTGAAGLVLLTIACAAARAGIPAQAGRAICGSAPLLPPTISPQEGNAYVNEMRRMIRARPEVESVVSQHGRPDDGTDAAGSSMPEFFAP